MYRIILSIFIGIFCSASLSAFELKGTVTDKRKDPIPFTNVFLKSEPTIGTVTDEEGRFSLKLDSRHAEDTLVFSFIGYKTTMIDLGKIRNLQRPIRVVLPEDVIDMDEVIVRARPQRMSERKQVKTLLEKVREQMKKDFPPVERSYEIRSNYYVFDHDKIVAYEDAVGELHEIPIKGMFGMDSLTFKIKKKQTHFDPEAKDMALMLSDSLLNKKQKAMVKDAQSKNIVHEAFWGSHPVTLFDRLDSKPKHWEKARLENGDLLLVYTDKRNMFGFVKYKMTVTYVLDPYTYSIQSVRQVIDGEAHIPFGYKLDETQLKVLNLFTQGKPIDKFKIKHAYGSIEKRSRYESVKGHMRPSDKYVVAKSQILDRKDRGIELHNTANIEVLRHLK